MSTDESTSIWCPFMKTRVFMLLDATTGESVGPVRHQLGSMKPCNTSLPFFRPSRLAFIIMRILTASRFFLTMSASLPLMWTSRRRCISVISFSYPCTHSSISEAIRSMPSLSSSLLTMSAADGAVAIPASALLACSCHRSPASYLRTMSLAPWSVSCRAGSQELSDSGYPFHFTRYIFRLLTVLLSRIASASYTFEPSATSPGSMIASCGITGIGSHGENRSMNLSSLFSSGFGVPRRSGKTLSYTRTVVAVSTAPRTQRLAS